MKNVGNPNITVNMENVDFFEIDLDNPPFNPEIADADYLETLEKENAEFIDEKLIPEMLRAAAPCQCRTGEFMAKNQKRAMLLGVRPGEQFAAQLDQEDVDANQFGAIVMMRQGKYTEIACIVRECKRCHKIDIYGRSNVLTRLFAESYTHYAEAEEAELIATDLDVDPNVEEDIGEPVNLAEGDSAETLK